MLQKNNLWPLSASAVLAIFIASTSANASNMDGSSDIICAVMNVVACVDDHECIQGNSKKFDVPEIMILDAKNKVVRASYESGHEAISPVKSIEVNGNHLILQGVEESRGWTIAINSKTGNMNGSGVGDSLGFLLFGNCTTL